MQACLGIHQALEGQALVHEPARLEGGAGADDEQRRAEALDIRPVLAQLREVAQSRDSAVVADADHPPRPAAQRAEREGGAPGRLHDQVGQRLPDPDGHDATPWDDSWPAASADSAQRRSRRYQTSLSRKPGNAALRPLGLGTTNTRAS